MYVWARDVFYVRMAAHKNRTEHNVSCVREEHAWAWQPLFVYPYVCVCVCGSVMGEKYFDRTSNATRGISVGTLACQRFVAVVIEINSTRKIRDFILNSAQSAINK